LKSIEKKRSELNPRITNGLLRRVSFNLNIKTTTIIDSFRTLLEINYGIKMGHLVFK
jgi:hypothetical protein